MKDVLIIKDGKVGVISKPNTVEDIHAGLTKKGMVDYLLFNQNDCSLWIVDDTNDLTQLNRRPDGTAHYIVKRMPNIVDKLYAAISDKKCKNIFTVVIFNFKDVVGHVDLPGYKTSAMVEMAINDDSPSGLSVTYHISSKRGVPSDLRISNLRTIINIPGFSYIDRKPRLGDGTIATRESILDEAEMFHGQNEYTEYEYSTYLMYYVEKK